MMKRKNAPAAALLAAAIMSASVASGMPVLAAEDYILLLPASDGVTYQLSDEHVSEKYSSDEFTVLLYEAGETVDFTIITSRAYSMQDASTETDFGSYTASDTGEVSFVMPASDLCLILGEETETVVETVIEQPDETVEVSDENGISIILNGDCTAVVDMVDGTTHDMEQMGTFETKDDVDLVRLSSDTGFSNPVTVSIWENGEKLDDASSLVVSEGTWNGNHVVDLKNKMALNGNYIVQITMDGYEERDINGLTNQDEEKAAEDDGDVQVILFDGLKASVTTRSGETDEIVADGEIQKDEKITEIAVLADEGVPSDLDVELYKDGMKIDNDDIIEDASAKGNAFVVQFSDSFALDDSYRITVSLADDATFTEPEETEPAEELTTEESETADEAEITAEEPSEDVAEETEEGMSGDVTIAPQDTNTAIIEGNSFTFSVDIAEGLSKTDDFAVKANGQTLTENEDGTYTIYNVTEDQDVTVEGVADITGPETTVTVNGMQADGEMFVKGTATANITAKDAGSGVESVEFLVSDHLLDNAEDASGWEETSEDIAIPENAVSYVYVKAQDNEGNISYAEPITVVSYADSEANSDDLVYAKESGDDLAISLSLNGNTVSDVKIDEESVDFTETADGVSIAGDMLNMLSKGSHAVTISVNPLGEMYEEGHGDAPSDIELSMTVNNAEGFIIIDGSLSKEYDGTAVSAPSYQTGNSSKVKVKYKPVDASDDEYSSEAPKDAGEYMVRITAPADDNYTKATAESEFSIGKKNIDIVINDQSIDYGEEINTGIDAVSCDDLASGDAISSVTLSDDGYRISGDGIVITDSEGNDVTDNYMIVWKSGTLTVKDADQEAPSGLEGEKETILGKADGKIDGITEAMEYSTDGTSYMPVTSPDMEFASGEYYVRFAAGEHLNASEPVTVTVEEGTPLTIVFLIDGELADVREVAYGSSIADSDLPVIMLENGYTPVDAHWDVDDFSDITSDMIVHAVYTIEEFNVSLPSGDAGVTVTAKEQAEEAAENVSQETSLTIIVSDGINAQAVFYDNTSKDIASDESFTTEQPVSRIVLSCDEGFDEIPDIAVLRDDFEIGTNDSFYSIMLDDGECIITLDAGAEYDDMYIISVSR